MLSILSYNKLSGSVDGMDTVNKRLVEKYGDDKNYYPPVNTLFWSFRIMAGFGALMLLVAALGLFFTRKKKPSLYEKKWMLLDCCFMYVRTIPCQYNRLVSH